MKGVLCQRDRASQASVPSVLFSEIREGLGNEIGKQMGSTEGIATPIVAQIQKEIFDVQSIYLGKGFIDEIIEFLGMLIIDKAPDGENGRIALF